METLDPSNLETFVGLLFKAVQSGLWPLAGVLVLILVVHLARKPLAAKFPQLDSGAGAALLNLATGLLTGLGLKLLGGMPFTWALVGAVALSVFSAGGFSLVKALLPLFVPSLGDAQSVEAKAKAAGLAAANAKTVLTATDIINGPKP